MAATDNSPYQAIRLKHAQGIPPGCDPQRASETFSAYCARMWANGQWPDIGATEADVDYLVRIAGYGAVLFPPTRANYADSALTATSASFATTASWAPTNA